VVLQRAGNKLQQLGGGGVDELILIVHSNPMSRTTLYLTLWVLLLSHTVITRTIKQITLIDDVKHKAERIIAADQSSANDHVLVESISAMNTPQLNDTQGNLTSLCIRCSPGEFSTG